MAVWRKWGWLCACAFFPYVNADELADIRALRIIGDLPKALAVCNQAIQENPLARLLEERILLLAESGRLYEAILEWKRFGKASEHMLNGLCWNILKQSIESPHLLQRQWALLAITETNDVRGVSLIQEQMHATNGDIRALAVACSAQLSDQHLINSLYPLLEDESPKVRMECFEVIRRLQLRPFASNLKKILETKKLPYDEHMMVVRALTALYDDIRLEELQDLVASPHQGIRQLALSLIVELDKTCFCENFAFLALDDCINVQITALYMIGLLGQASESTAAIIQNCFSSSNKEVVLMACFAADRCCLDWDKEILVGYLSLEDIGRKTAALLGTMREGAVALLTEGLCHAADPFVRLNCAVSLLKQRSHVPKALDQVVLFLEEQTELLMEADWVAPVIVPTALRHNRFIAEYPNVVDAHLRLKLLHLLAIFEDKRAFEKVKKVLKTPLAGVAYMASTVLLEEGGGEFLPLVRQLLSDKDPKLRLQAAQLLAFFRKDSEGLRVLHEAFTDLDRNNKINILIALGKLADPTSIPFLLSHLDDPFPAIRLLSALALLQCLHS